MGKEIDTNEPEVHEDDLFDPKLIKESKIAHLKLLLEDCERTVIMLESALATYPMDALPMFATKAQYDKFLRVAEIYRMLIADDYGDVGDENALRTELLQLKTDIDSLAKEITAKYELKVEGAYMPSPMSFTPPFDGWNNKSTH